MEISTILFLKLTSIGNISISYNNIYLKKESVISASVYSRVCKLFKKKWNIYILIFLPFMLGNIASFFFCKTVMHNQESVYFKMLLKKKMEDWCICWEIWSFLPSFSSTMHYTKKTKITSRICFKSNCIQ